MSRLFLFLGIFVLSGCIVATGGQTLSLVNLSKLPSPIYNSAAFYDGYDHIYIMGGKNQDNSTLASIHRYRIAFDIIEYVGELPDPSYSALIQSDSRGHLWYFGGGQEGNLIYTYDPVTNITTTVTFTGVTSRIYRSGSTIRHKDGSNIIHCVGYGNGSRGNDVVSINLETLQATERPISSMPPTFWERGSVRISDGVALLYDAQSPTASWVHKVNLTAFTSTEGPRNLPPFISYVSSVFDGTWVYLIGGWDHTSGTHTEGIIKINPVTLEHTWVEVQNFPVEWYSHFTHPPKAVYVEKLDRIYLIGGRSWNFDRQLFVIHDDISYIDLNPTETTATTVSTTTDSGEPTTLLPGSEETTTSVVTTTTLNPDIFSCVNRTDGTYPHPTNCEMFIICHDGITDVFTCPPPLLFDPTTKSCKLPYQVTCALSCMNKPDGTYPHPKDCSLFIICHSEQLDVYKCPPPLLFDPVELTCKLPELVDCLN